MLFYTKDEMLAVKAQEKKLRRLMLMIAAVLAVITIVLAVLRLKIPTVVLTVLLGGWLIFAQELIMAPVKSELALMEGTMSDRIHEMEAVFDRCGDAALINGVRAHGTYWIENPDSPKPAEHLLYTDDTRELPEFVKGQSMRVIYHGRMLVGIRK